MLKHLILDIETAPSQVFSWGLFDQTISLNQIIKPGSTMAWAAKWHGKEEVEYSSINITSHKNMIKEIWLLMNEAQQITGWNSNSFDLKLLNAAFAVYGLGPPSPYRKVDLMREVKKQMKFLSNKLDFISGQFGVGHKLEHKGFNLWVECMEGKQEAWDTMHEYNCEDVLLTERVYDKLVPWITSATNLSAFHNDHVCPNCGNNVLQKRGTSMTTSLTYQRWQCVGAKGCGAWSRSKIADKADRKAQLMPIR